MITITTTDDGQGGVVGHKLLLSQSVKDTNDAPTDITLSKDTINENSAHRNFSWVHSATMDEDDPRS